MTGNIYNGKKVLRGIIDRIDEHNDTSGWGGDEIKWAGAIEEEFDVIHDDDNGERDLCDLLALVLGKYDGDTAYTAKVACYGLAYVIANDIISARELDMECYLLM